MKVTYLLYKDQLSGEYLKTFDKIELYTQIYNIDFDVSNEILLDLENAFLDAQKAGRPVQKIVGSDIEQFCRICFENYTGKQRIQYAAKRIRTVCFFILFIEMISFLLNVPGSLSEFFNYKTDMAVYLCGALSGIVISTIMEMVGRRMMFRWENFSTKIFSWITYGSLAIVLVITICFIHFSVKFLLWPLLLLTIIYLIVYEIAAAIGRIHRGEPVFESPAIKRRRLADEGEKISFANSVAEGLPLELIKRYERINKRRERKGKAPLSHEEYMNKMEKESSGNKVSLKIGILMVALLYITLVVAVGLEDGLVNTIGFALILAICYIPVVFFWKSLKKGDCVKKEIIEEYKRSGKDLFMLYGEGKEE